MRILSWRLITALVIGITVISLGSSWYETRTEKQTLRSDLERKAGTLGESLAGTAELYLETGDRTDLDQLVRRFSNREHLAGVAVYGEDGAPLALTPALATVLPNAPKVLLNAIESDRTEGGYTRTVFKQYYLLAIPLHGSGNSLIGGIVVVYDSSYIRAQIFRAWGSVFIRIILQVLVIVAFTVLIVRWSLIGPIMRVAEWVKALRTGQHPPPPSTHEIQFLLPLTREVVPLAASIEQAREAAATEARLRNAKDSEWTAQRLAAYVRDKLGGKLYVISNREPYVHAHRGQGIAVSAPASGLVAALEPVLCACDGTWIAYGSGDADAETVDASDRLRVPPGEMRYTLRRVWLSHEEESGYYYGFSNEGIWPLCHNAHTRPVFRAADWEQYQRVNRKFANVLAEEISDEEQPVVLIQDYHFALLPRMVKERLPHARVAIFWHIPWPNPESFEICPWQSQLLDGLLGADLIGFHVRAHCNNFLNTVDHALEARIDWEHFTVTRNEHPSHVLPFPISVELKKDPLEHSQVRSVEEERRTALEELGLDTTWIGVGVDRVDYTKGIVERFQAVESFLVRYPEYQGKFTFIELAAPSRSEIKRYAELQEEVECEAARINDRFAGGQWKPIVLLLKQHTRQEVQRFYRIAHLCMVTSLHDGMNLVAKEYAAAQQEEQGVLILSRFTGAARELRDALMVNPYDIQATGEAVAQALRMEAGERMERMRRMRATIREHNIYWWAGSLIGGLCDIRVGSSEIASISDRTTVEV